MSPERGQVDKNGARRSGRKPGSQAGYTLVELLVVIALAGVMLAAVPAFATRLLPSARFDARFETLRDTLAETRAVAGASGSVVEFDMEPWGDELAFTPAPLAGAQETGLRFYGRDGATGGVLVFKDETRARALEVDWLTGRAFEIESEQ